MSTNKHELNNMNHLSNSWSVDKGSRSQGFKDSSEKALKTNKNNTMIIGVTIL